MYRLKAKIENTTLYIKVGFIYGKNYKTLQYGQFLAFEIKCFEKKPVSNKEFAKRVKQSQTLDLQTKKMLLLLVSIWQTDNLNYEKNGTKYQIDLIKKHEYTEENVPIDRGIKFNEEKLIKKLSLTHANKLIAIIQYIDKSFKMDYLY